MGRRIVDGYFKGCLGSADILLSSRIRTVSAGFGRAAIAASGPARRDDSQGVRPAGLSGRPRGSAGDETGADGAHSGRTPSWRRPTSHLRYRRFARRSGTARTASSSFRPSRPGGTVLSRLSSTGRREGLVHVRDAGSFSPASLSPSRDHRIGGWPRRHALVVARHLRKRRMSQPPPGSPFPLPSPYRPPAAIPMSQISPDGRRMALVVTTGSRIWLRNIENWLRCPSRAPKARGRFWAPDSQQWPSSLDRS